MLSREELHVTPSVQVGITRTQVVVKVDQAPRRTTHKFKNEMVVSLYVDHLVPRVKLSKVGVSNFFIIKDQDSHEITPHSFGPIV
jgi:hypothetical protein